MDGKQLATRPARSFGALLGLAAVLVLAAGCVSAPHRPARVRPWPQHRARLLALAQYELTGRVAVAAGNDGFSAHLEWTQSGPRTALQLNGPLGLGAMHVVSDGGTIDVRTSKGEQLTSEEARAELENKLGFEPPLASLRYWLVGVPDPGHPAVETVGPDQRLAALAQDGWQIVYSGYLEAGGYALPRRIAMRRANVRVRVVVDRWQPHSG